MITDKSINTHIDTIGLRCVCYSKYDRDNMFNKIITFIKEQHRVGIVFDKKISTKYYQTTKLQFGNSTLATISKGYFEQTSKSGYRAEYYYININFYGLMRYNKNIDNISLFLVHTVSAYLNTNNIHFRLTEIDMAMDINAQLDNVLALCTKRTANINYFQLGTIDIDGNDIQEYSGTYNIEKFESHKQKKNAMSRAYLYDKRKKEIEKFKRDIGFELTRFELKLQKRYFVKNKYTGSSLYIAIQKYSVLYFEDLNQKKLFIKQFNKANTSRKRKKVITTVIDNNDASLLTPNLNNVYKLLREIDSIIFDAKGNLKYMKHESYLYCQSKFNRKY